MRYLPFVLDGFVSDFVLMSRSFIWHVFSLISVWCPCLHLHALQYGSSFVTSLASGVKQS
jgi:hypothetical protein